MMEMCMAMMKNEPMQSMMKKMMMCGEEKAVSTARDAGEGTKMLSAPARKKQAAPATPVDEHAGHH
jgi:hypothetical protein